MLNKIRLIGLGAGMAVVAAFLVFVVWIQKGATPHLAGAITNVRTLGMDESSSVAIVDLRFTNDSDHPFVVGSTSMSVVDATGAAHDGQVIAADYIGQLFQLFPALGVRVGEPVIFKTRIRAHASFVGVLAARFEVPKADLDGRQKLTLSIGDVDGAVSQITR